MCDTCAMHNAVTNLLCIEVWHAANDTLYRNVLVNIQKTPTNVTECIEVNRKSQILWKSQIPLH